MHYIFTFACLAFSVSAASGPKLNTSFASVQGTFSHKSEWVQNCNFDRWPQPPGLPTIAVANNLYEGAGYCGVCAEVKAAQSTTGPRKVGIINTRCADCPNNSLNIAPELWNAIVPANAQKVIPGRALIDWKVVPCPLTTKMVLIGKKGSAPGWLALQVASAKLPIESVKIQAKHSLRVIPLVRQNYNFFTLPQGTTLSGNLIDVLVTCTNTKSVMFVDVPYKDKDLFMTGLSNC
ncbi:hypothetical protein O181_036795 [Austropuccinia psidii MF-1]|uniref:Expansin-like EG45 domain-containing protein n=1 Tax=Austropuccinia psidii MF-1 TaxID=1389203 RepID=A0A9Q3HCI1_9BASI|nr:hypothetical protein [Austropuccinia psidii MF-1]